MVPIKNIDKVFIPQLMALKKLSITVESYFIICQIACVVVVVVVVF